MAHGQHHLCSPNALAAVLSQHGRTATSCTAEGVCISGHSGEFVQIVHVGNNHCCVVSMVGCESGAVYVYDGLYKSPTKELIHLIASMIHSQSNELKITMMDVEKQSNGSDCGVLAIAYAFNL